MATQDEINHINQLAGQRRYKQKNKAVLAVKVRALKDANKDKYKIRRKQRDVERKMGLPPPPKQWNYAARRLSVYKTNACRDGRVWALTDPEATALILGECWYCAAVANHTNGIDRVDNVLPYTPENTVSACWTCNRMKGQMGREEFLEHCKKILTRRG
jgi:5-methylcytosine-specific restriction endonuclease McrA